MRRKMCKRKGFTMVELMVVIIIMAILGLAVMPALMGSSEKAKYSRAWNDLNAISNAFTAFYGRVGNLPDISATTLDNNTITTQTFTVPGSTTTISAKDLFQSFLGTPLDNLYDPWGARYAIKSTWSSTSGKGAIVVYVTGGTTGTASFGGSGEGAISVSARKDPYNGDIPMAKLVVNVM